MAAQLLSRAVRGLAVHGAPRRMAGTKGASSWSDHIVITGGRGNLGTKLARHFLGCGTRVTVLDAAGGPGPVEGVDYVQADLSKFDATWLELLKDARPKGIIHLAAVNPYPEASWEEAALSMDVTANVFLAAANAKIPRVVHASSNHVMGGYKDEDRDKPIRPDSPVRLGTIWDASGTMMNSTAYATPKLMGERLARALGQASSTSFVCLRIGWCQPGANSPHTLNAAGTPTQATVEESSVNVHAGDTLRDPVIVGEWYRSMWLANPDMLQVMTRAVEAPLPASERGCVVLNAMSGNTGMRWDISKTRAILGYEPVEDVARHIKSKA